MLAPYPSRPSVDKSVFLRFLTCIYLQSGRTDFTLFQKIFKFSVSSNVVVSNSISLLEKNDAFYTTESCVILKVFIWTDEGKEGILELALLEASTKQKNL